MHPNFDKPKFFLDVKCALNYTEKLKLTWIATTTLYEVQNMDEKLELVQMLHIIYEGLCKQALYKIQFYWIICSLFVDVHRDWWRNNIFQKQPITAQDCYPKFYSPKVKIDWLFYKLGWFNSFHKILSYTRIISNNIYTIPFI